MSRTAAHPHFPRPSQRPPRGYALMVSMGLMTMLTLLGTTFVGLTQTERGISAAYVDRVRASMIAQSGIDMAVAHLTSCDRVQPWAGHYSRTDGVTGAVYLDDGAGVNFPAGVRDGGSDRWFYGELFRPTVDGAAGGDQRQHGRAILQPGAAAHVSFYAGTVTLPGQAPYAYSGPKLGESGLAATHGRTANHPGDFFILKVADCASRIHVNDSDTGGRLGRILDNLGAELDPPIAMLGTRILSERAARGPFTGPEDLHGRVFGADPSEWDRVREFVTTRSWQDPASLRIPFSGVTDVRDCLDPRSPIDINTAPREVLSAVIRGLAATYSKRTANGLVRTTVRIPDADVHAIADWLILTRSYWGGNVSAPTAYPHVDWMHVSQDAFDTMDGRPGAPRLTQEQRDLLKAMFNPNTDLKKFNPDRLFMDPDRTGRTDFTTLDKTDITTGTTEMCFGSMGYYEISSLGRVLRADGGLLAEATVSTMIQTHEVLRLTTQADFERDREFDDAAESAPGPQGGRLPGVVSLPENPHRRADGDASWAAAYDGQLTLNGFVNHRGTDRSLLVGFAPQVAPGAPRSGMANGIPDAPTMRQRNGALRVLGGLVGRPNELSNGRYTGSMLYPFGGHVDAQRRTNGWLEYDRTHMKAGEGTLEFLFKPEVDLVGRSGWETKTVWLADFAGPSNFDALRVRVKNRRLQAAFYLAPESRQVRGTRVIRGRTRSVTRTEQVRRSTFVTLTGDLTVHADAQDPLAWAPHTWHHVEVSWKAGDAKLFLDGELVATAALPYVFEPNVARLQAGTSAPTSSPRLLFGAYVNGDHDATVNSASSVVGTYDNICVHPKRMHEEGFAPRSRYHDLTYRGYTYTPSGPSDIDVNGSFGLYQKRLRAIEDAAAKGKVTLLTMSCTHWHPPHEHSTGDHSGTARTRGALGLGHVTVGLRTGGTRYAFDYDNCAGTPCRTVVAGSPKWIQLGAGEPLTLLVKLELAENAPLPHNEAPIVDDVTLTWTTGVKFLSWSTE